VSDIAPAREKVFAIGFYKTGTTTLYEALRLLGLRAINGDKPGSYPGADDGATLLRQIRLATTGCRRSTCSMPSRTTRTSICGARCTGSFRRRSTS
jgi:hypothetical protein